VSGKRALDLDALAAEIKWTCGLWVYVDEDKHGLYVYRSNKADWQDRALIVLGDGSFLRGKNDSFHPRDWAALDILRRHLVAAGLVPA
jgi:hypothetical protein